MQFKWLVDTLQSVDIDRKRRLSSSQGEICLYWKFRNCLATVNGSKGQRDRWCRVACDDKTTACL